MTTNAGILTKLFKALAARSRLSDNVGSLIKSKNNRRLNGR